MRTCAKYNKTCYATESIAKQELAFCRMAFLNGNDSYTQIRYYKCDHCKDYHLTSKKLKQTEIISNEEKN